MIYSRNMRGLDQKRRLMFSKKGGGIPALSSQIFLPEGRIIGRHALFRQMANFGCVIIGFEQV